MWTRFGDLKDENGHDFFVRFVCYNVTTSPCFVQVSTEYCDEGQDTQVHPPTLLFSRLLKKAYHFLLLGLSLHEDEPALQVWVERE